VAVPCGDVILEALGLAGACNSAVGFDPRMLHVRHHLEHRAPNRINQPRVFCECRVGGDDAVVDRPLAGCLVGLAGVNHAHDAEPVGHVVEQRAIPGFARAASVFCHAPRGHIQVDACHSHRVAGGVALNASLAGQPADSPVRLTNTELDVVGCDARNSVRDRRIQTRLVVGVNLGQDDT
jgi:hypothetical protein